MAPYEIKDITTSHHWLGHKSQFTEMGAFHPDYKVGREHYEFNFNNKTFPKIAYAKGVGEVINFVKKHTGSHMVCYGLNPRPEIRRNAKNYPRASKESEIQLSQNLVMDFDFIDKRYLDEKLASLEINFRGFDEYFRDHGIHPPVRGFSGQGYHFLFGYCPIVVKDTPDISQRIKTFQGDFRQEFYKSLDDLGVKVDSVHDLKRMLKIYGTAKPGIKVTSGFWGNKRHEDEGIRTHLLNIKIPEPIGYTIDDKLIGELPKLFQHLLQVDPKLQELWQGTGKNSNQDTSRSGYDFSIVKHLLELGYSNVDDLKQVLNARPKGAVKESGKGESYVKHTLANAIKS